MKIPHATVRQLLEHIVRTRAEELDCDQVYHVVDVFVERIANGEDVVNLFPLVLHHLDLCSGCHEECEALLHALSSTTQSSLLRDLSVQISAQAASFQGASYTSENSTG
jgi:hypothetical protein